MAELDPDIIIHGISQHVSVTDMATLFCTCSELYINNTLTTWKTLMLKHKISGVSNKLLMDIFDDLKEYHSVYSEICQYATIYNFMKSGDTHVIFNMLTNIYTKYNRNEFIHHGMSNNAHDFCNIIQRLYPDMYDYTVRSINEGKKIKYDWKDKKLNKVYNTLDIIIKNHNECLQSDYIYNIFKNLIRDGKLSMIKFLDTVCDNRIIDDSNYHWRQISKSKGRYAHRTYFARPSYMDIAIKYRKFDIFKHYCDKREEEDKGYYTCDSHQGKQYKFINEPRNESLVMACKANNLLVIKFYGIDSEPTLSIYNDVFRFSIANENFDITKYVYKRFSLPDIVSGIIHLRKKLYISIKTYFNCLSYFFIAYGPHIEDSDLQTIISHMNKSKNKKSELEEKSGVTGLLYILSKMVHITNLTL